MVVDTKGIDRADLESYVRSLIKEVPDYPHDGINFKDITPVLNDVTAFRGCIDKMAEYVRATNATRLAGLESRGYPFVGALSYATGIPHVILRKSGKLPRPTIACDYGREYGAERIEIHQDCIMRGDRVVVVDDVLATGGTVGAANTLIEKLDGIVVGYCFLAELDFLEGRNGIKVPIFSLVHYNR